MNDTLRALVDLRDRTLQKSRIQFGNRISAVENGKDTVNGETLEVLTRWNMRFDELEQMADKDISRFVCDVPIVQQMTCVKGIGKLLAAKVVAMVDITRADTVSALWRYAGYGVVEGARERPTKGEKLHYNARLKTTCYLIGSSFLRSGSPYRSVYDAAREYYEKNRPDWTKGHQHNAAMRKMIKAFLAHLWERWRQLEGLPTRELYAMEQMGHTHYMRAEEFGWPEIAGNSKEPNGVERAGLGE